ncbi:MAG TPA: sialidase family protein [Acidimicrobiales bacterium]|nr:sialidase family protein [Acidimicrobiales bacterium]
MAIDPDFGKGGRLHLVWLKATSDPPLGAFGPPPNPILTAYSDDGGRTFSDPVQVSDPARSLVVAPAMAIGRDHRLHVAYYDLKEDAVDYQGLEGPVWEGTWSIVLSTSDPEASRFKHSVAEASVAPPERVMLIFTMAPPALAVRNDHVCLAWPDARRGDPDVMSRCSSDRGDNWAPPRRLNDDRVGNGLNQLMPRLSFAPTGRLDAIFYDRRRHPSNVLNHVFLTFSTDGGRQWAPNKRLTSHASSSNVGPQYANPSAQGKVEFGSRLGLLSGPRGLVAAWADTRNSSPTGTGQDVFTTIVHIRGTSNSRTNLVVGGAGLIVLGALTVLAARRRSTRIPEPPATSGTGAE